MRDALLKINEGIYEINFTRQEFNFQRLNPKAFPSSEFLLGEFSSMVSEVKLCCSIDHFYSEIQRLETLDKFRWNHEMRLANYNTVSHNKTIPKSTFGGYRYVNQIAFFIDYMNLDADLSGKEVLDVGPWSGSSSVIYEKLGGHVDAVEEGEQQIELMKFIKNSFNLDFNIIKDTIYNVKEYGKYDLVSNFGVLYHVTDPLIFLRICYNALKPSGVMILETMSTNDCSNDSFMRYEGSFKLGANWFIPNRIALLRLLQDAGFVNIKVAGIHDDQSYGRIFAFAQKRESNDQWEPLKLGWSKELD